MKRKALREKFCFGGGSKPPPYEPIITQIGRESKSDIPTSSEWYYRLRDSDMKAFGFRDILFAIKLA